MLEGGPGFVGNRRQVLGLLAKGLKLGGHLCVDRYDRLLKRLDLPQVELEKETMMGEHPPTQGLDERQPIGSQPSRRDREQRLGIRLAGDERLEDSAPACATDVADDRSDFDVGVFQTITDRRARRSSSNLITAVTPRSRTPSATSSTVSVSRKARGRSAACSPPANVARAPLRISGGASQPYNRSRRAVLAGQHPDLPSPSRRPPSLGRNGSGESA